MQSALYKAASSISQCDHVEKEQASGTRTPAGLSHSTKKTQEQESLLTVLSTQPGVMADAPHTSVIIEVSPSDKIRNQYLPTMSDSQHFYKFLTGPVNDMCASYTKP